MACANVFDALRVATEHLGKELYHRATFQNLWLNAIPRGEFPKHVGLTKSVFEMGNAYPTTTHRSWDSYTLATGSNAGACAYNFIDYTVGYDELTYSPKRLQLRGPLWCKDDFNFDHMSDEFLNGYVVELTKLVEWELGNHLEFEYLNKVPIVVATASPNFTAPGAGLVALPDATSDLTQQLLDRVAVKLIHSRATNPDSQGFVTLDNGAPLFTLSLGMEAHQAVLLGNEEFRKDLREGAMNFELFKRLGANTAIKNFRHVIDPVPIRFTFSGGTYTVVERYVNVSGSKGTYQELNPAWEDPSSAPYEGAWIMSPNVMTWDWVTPSNVVGGQRWDPMSYMGDWKWITGSEACATDGSGYDPFKKYGRHIAEISGAAKPGSNRGSGMLIIFKRCQLSTITGTTCS